MFTQLKHYYGLQSIITNGFFQTCAVFYKFFIRFIYIIILSRWLGPEDYGFYAYALSYFLIFFPIVPLGSDVALPREIGKNKAAARDALAGSFWLCAGMGIVMFLIAGFIALWAEPLWHYKLILILACVALLPRAYEIWANSVLLGYEKSAFILKLVILYRTLEVAAGVAALWFFDAALWVFIVIHICSWVGHALHGCLYIHKHIMPLKFSIKWPAYCDIKGENLQLTAQKFLLASILGSVLLFYRHTTESLLLFGQFAIAYQLVRVAAEILQAHNWAAAPILARSLARGDGKDERYAIYSSFGLFAAGWSVVAMLHLIGEPLILFAFGQQYAGAAAIISLVSLWLPFYVMQAPLRLFFQTRGLNWPIIRGYFLTLIVIAFYGYYSGTSDPADLVYAIGLGMLLANVYWLYVWRQCTQKRAVL